MSWVVWMCVGRGCGGCLDLSEEYLGAVLGVSGHVSEMSGRCLGGVWTFFGGVGGVWICLKTVWELSLGCLGVVWTCLGGVLGVSGSVLGVSLGCVGGVWGMSLGCLGGVWTCVGVV